jgi:hypothetical protein
MPRTSPNHRAGPEWQKMARRYHVHFRGPVQIDEDTVRELCRLARHGYDTPMKRETYGFLYGSLTEKGRLVIRRSCYYRGGTKTRSGVVFKDWPSVGRVARRRQELARKMRMRFVGSFHSHVEIAGEVFRGISDEDRDSFANDPMATLELIVFVWEGSNHGLARSGRDIVGFEPATGYRYRIRCYARRARAVRQVTLKVIPAGVTIVY